MPASHSHVPVVQGRTLVQGRSLKWDSNSSRQARTRETAPPGGKRKRRGCWETRLGGGPRAGRPRPVAVSSRGARPCMAVLPRTRAAGLRAKVRGSIDPLIDGSLGWFCKSSSVPSTAQFRRASEPETIIPPLYRRRNNRGEEATWRGSQNLLGAEPGRGVWGLAPASAPMACRLLPAVPGSPPRTVAGSSPRGTTDALCPPGRFGLADARGPTSGRGRKGRRCGGLEPPEPPRPPGGRHREWGSTRATELCGRSARPFRGSRPRWPLQTRGPRAPRQQPPGRGEPALPGASRGPWTPAPEKATVFWFLYQPLSLRSLGTF